MNEDQPAGVLGALPRTRPHRRSDKRAAPPSASVDAKPAGTATPAKSTRPSTKPAGTGAPGASVAPEPGQATGPLGTAVQAAAELAGTGLMAGARALRGALSRLPHR